MSMPSVSTFERLEIRYRFRAHLVAVTGLRVGAGKRFDAAATDQPVIRDALGRPFIPGSSLKGCLRSGLESILRGLDRPPLSACDLFVEPCVGPPDSQRQRGRQPKISLAEVQEKICTVCSLFGSPYLAGRVFVHDLPCVEGSQPEIRDGVGIDRDLGTARPKVKYDTEVVPAESRFQLEMTLENTDPVRLALVLRTLALLHEGEILLGGLTSRGLGRVKLEGQSLEHTKPELLLVPPDRESQNPYVALDLEEEQHKARSRLLELVRDGGDA